MSGSISSPVHGPSDGANLPFGITAILEDPKQSKSPGLFAAYSSIFSGNATIWSAPNLRCFPTPFPKFIQPLEIGASPLLTPDQLESRKEKRLGHPYQNRAPAKHKKPRTSFTKAQVALLETKFLDRKYLASSERAILASQLKMSDSQVKTWFQNRRTKWRRQEAEEREYENKAASKMISSFTAQCLLMPTNLNS